jgi:hypothetical protein
MTLRVISWIGALMLVGSFSLEAWANEKPTQSKVRLEGRVSPSLRGDWEQGSLRLQSNGVGAQHWRLSSQGEAIRVIRLDGPQTESFQPRGFLEVASPR